MKTPDPRGPLSSALLDALGSAPAAAPGLPALAEAAGTALEQTADIFRDEDVQLALFCLYELHYTGLDGVDAGWEWHPGLLAVRVRLEQAYEAALRRLVRLPEPPQATSAAVADALFTLTGNDDGPSVSRFVAASATREQLQEFLVHRSIYQLKEADPHSWAIPRLTGRAKAALVEIQADEYGGGRAHRMHSTLFAGTLRGVGLEDSYGAYIDHIPAVTLAALNMMSLFGLNRRLRGAIVGHLAAFEMTSSIPNRFYARGVRRLGYGDDVALYFDEHVEADAVHEQIAARDMAGGLAEASPELVPDILFGTAACLAMDAMVGGHQLAAWQNGTSSLRLPLPEPVGSATI
ncbi:iron-containing redox enzyme family protein [Arthrobacter mobilis]|uniref:iron-containing redox enzyme family protein n=1 Tax=Arthrobacter mobilis TaxID=2724944 RepID=UPI0028A73CA2|nr:iron-containing redox enzyme family protein [Arthrobacter mobilis]